MMVWEGSLLFYGCRKTEKPTHKEVPAYADFEVQVGEECFILRLIEPTQIREARALLKENSSSKFPTGKLQRGDGGFNRCGVYRWSWHMDPASVSFAEVATEVCDGLPSFVEERVDYWVDTLQNYCPWSARLLRELP